MSEKKSIFLSHATPEDNEFTRWLGAKLTLAGYEVWYDLERLRGGDISWNKIERAIREETVRFVAIISAISHRKDGVRKEWTLASIIEKKNAGFVIPIRVDEFNFDDVTILFSGKNVLDFHRDWFGGLTRLLETLQDAQIPHASVPDAAQASLWWKSSLSTPIDLTDREERVESSWLPILSLPPAVETTIKLSSVAHVPLTENNRAIPWFEHGTHLVSFARQALLIELLKDHVALKAGSAFSTVDLLAGNVVFDRQVAPEDARNRVSFLVRQAWDLAMEQAKLRQAEFAGRQTVWFVPKGLTSNDYFEFFDENNKKRRRQLVGHSEKYGVNWHYGVSATPTLGKPLRMELRVHILFSEESGDLVSSTARAHRLRRSFCRNWWNARWRDFQRALLAYLSQNSDRIQLPVGSDRYVELASSPFTFTSPVGLADNSEQVNEEKIAVDDEIDESAMDDEEDSTDSELDQEKGL